MLNVIKTIKLRENNVVREKYKKIYGINIQLIIIVTLTYSKYVV